MRTLTITSLAMDGDNARVTVRVDDGGSDVTPPTLNPVIIVNPPILVPDANGDIERSSVDPRTGVETFVYYREDPRAALLSVLTSLV